VTKKEMTASFFGGAPVHPQIGVSLSKHEPFLCISTVQKSHLHTGVMGETKNLANKSKRTCVISSKVFD
jgi:hypothetical protein